MFNLCFLVANAQIHWSWRNLHFFDLSPLILQHTQLSCLLRRNSSEQRSPYGYCSHSFAAILCTWLGLTKHSRTREKGESDLFSMKVSGTARWGLSDEIRIIGVSSKLRASGANKCELRQTRNRAMESLKRDSALMRCIEPLWNLLSPRPPRKLGLMIKIVCRWILTIIFLSEAFISLVLLLPIPIYRDVRLTQQSSVYLYVRQFGNKYRGPSHWPLLLM